MKMLGKLQSLVSKKPSKEEQALAEKLETAKAEKKKLMAHYFVLQALESLKKLELDGGSFICSDPDFECYFKKKHMPLFEEKNAYIKIAFDKADNATHVCGLLARLQNEKTREKIDDEKITLSKMPKCLLSRAIAEMAPAPRNGMSKARNVVHQGQTVSTQQQVSKAGNVAYQGQSAPTQQKASKAVNFTHRGQSVSTGEQGSNFVFDPNNASRSLKGVEKEWLDTMHSALVDSEFRILLHLLQHSIIARGFQVKIEHFLNTRQELEPGSRSAVLNSFKYLAREFQPNEQIISVARIGSSLERRFKIKPQDIFSIIVELFLCLGYEKEIKGYTTGFMESA